MIFNCAFASDGGCIWLALNEDGRGAAYKLNRSIGSRGTSQYEAITDNDGALVTAEGRLALLVTLRRHREAIGDDDRCCQAVDEFICVLSRDT